MLRVCLASEVADATRDDVGEETLQTAGWRVDVVSPGFLSDVSVPSIVLLSGLGESD